MKSQESSEGNEPSRPPSSSRHRDAGRLKHRRQHLAVAEHERRTSAEATSSPKSRRSRSTIAAYRGRWSRPRPPRPAAPPPHTRTISRSAAGRSSKNNSPNWLPPRRSYRPRTEAPPPAPGQLIPGAIRPATASIPSLTSAPMTAPSPRSAPPPPWSTCRSRRRRLAHAGPPDLRGVATAGPLRKQGRDEELLIDFGCNPGDLTGPAGADRDPSSACRRVEAPSTVQLWASARRQWKIKLPERVGR